MDHHTHGQEHAHGHSHADPHGHAGHGGASGHGGHGGHDAWHVPADQLRGHVIGENVAVGQLLIYGTAAFMIVVGAVVATSVYFYWYANQLAIARVQNFDANAQSDEQKLQAVYLAEVNKSQSEFKEYGWHDDKRVRIPLRGEGSAFEAVVAEYAKKGK